MPWELGTGSIAAQVPGYEVLHPAGEGSMGRVFVARQTALNNRLVALKFLSVDHDADPDERLARFRREAAIMASLSHPNVLSVYDYGEIDECPYLVLEYVEGGDLRHLMSGGRPMPIDRVIATIAPVAEALGYLHGRGILHRDLKPENILMCANHVPKVADFGIAVERSGSGELTRSGQGLGTLGYIAPEQQFRLPVDERADQYSLAAMSYEMLTGQRPLGLFKPPSYYNPRLSPAADRAILRGLQEDPDDRFPTVLEFSHALTRSLEHPRGASRRVLWASAAVAVFFASAALWIASGLGRDAGKKDAVARRQPAEDPPSAAVLTNTLPAPAIVTKPAPAIVAKPAFTHVVPASKPPSAKPDPRRDRLTAHIAQQFWAEQGKPEGEEGRAVELTNWYNAQKTVQKALEERAYQISQARKRGEAQAGTTVDELAKQEADWRQAEGELTREWLGEGASSDAGPAPR